MKQILATQNNKKRLTWTDEDPKIKKGNSIRFKDEDEFLSDFFTKEDLFDELNKINRYLSCRFSES